MSRIDTDRAPYQKTGRAHSDLRKAAKGQQCTLQIPGVCSHDPAKTVGCHMRFFGAGGMGVKPHDVFIIDACSSCHAVLDDRSSWADAGLGWDDVLRAFMQTLQRRVSAGLVRVGKE